MDSTDFLIFMANQTTSTVGAWENLENMGDNTINLTSEEGHTATIQCDDLMELHRLAQVSHTLAEGYDVKLEWRVP
ncbi:MAG: hypothetical protein EB075_13030 [Bacteroidetes bacterium]|nr:hypothetical protein [Bacteroidota bacterium]